MGNPEEALVSWPSPGSCDHLGSEPAGRFSSSLSSCFCNSTVGLHSSFERNLLPCQKEKKCVLLCVFSLGRFQPTGTHRQYSAATQRLAHRCRHLQQSRGRRAREGTESWHSHQGRWLGQPLPRLDFSLPCPLGSRSPVLTWHCCFLGETSCPCPYSVGVSSQESGKYAI